MSELKTWEDGELIGLLRSEIQYVEDFTDTGRLDDVVEEVERRLIQSSEMLEEHLGHYDKEFIQKIKAGKIKLITMDEFKDSNSKILSEHLQVEKFQKRCEKYESALIESEELLRDMNRECDGLSESENTLYNIVKEALVEEPMVKSAKDTINRKTQVSVVQNSSSFKPQPIYSIPSDIAKIIDETDMTDIDSDIPQEAFDWVDELKDDYLGWVGRMFLVLAYCNPLTSPKAFPNIWKVE